MKSLSLITPDGAPSWKFVRLLKTLEQAERLIFQHYTLNDQGKRENFALLLASIETLHDGIDAKDEHLHVNWRDVSVYYNFRSLIETAYQLAGGAAFRVVHYHNAVKVSPRAEIRQNRILPGETEERQVDTSPPPLPEDVAKASKELKAEMAERLVPRK